MTKINIFKNKEKSIDLPKFIDSRALVCANSGGGKSYAIRKLLEETHGKVMSIVLDVEGEFKTLREEYDFLLIGQAGDVPLSMNAAHLLPEKLLELNISTIIDISELKKHERVLYVKKFLEAMMELPRKFWKPCIVVVDEAHNLAGQQDKHESGPAVIDLMSRGRKRGFCLHPDVKIITSAGIKKIKEIQIGDYVLTHNGRYKKVVAKSIREYCGEMVSITSVGIYHPTITTPNHLYLSHIVNSKHGIKILNNCTWQEANILKHNPKGKTSSASYRIYSPVIKEDIDKDLIYYEYKKRKRDRSSRIKKKGEGYNKVLLPLNKDLLTVMGYFLAEGSYIKRRYQIEKNMCGIQFSFGKNANEKRYSQETFDCLVRLGYSPELKILKSGCFYIRLRVREIAELFKYYLGEYSHSKFIHKDILCLPKEKLKCLFDSYICGDGHTRMNFIGASTVSENLAYGIGLIGQKLGYSTTIKIDKRTNAIIITRNCKLRDIYRISFKNLSVYSKNKKVENDYVRAIKEKKSFFYAGKVYNLQVEEDESYCSLGHVLHNCGILATQRIAKLHKDACAECNNVMIGRTGLDVDMKRAAELLGFTSKEQMLSLRDLEEGEFYVFGPAISRHVEKEKVAEVKTTHPKVGMDVRAKLIPPTEKVKNILSNLKGLPEDAKKDKIDKEDMRKEILRLKNEVRNNKPVIDDNALKISFDKGYKKAQNEHEIKLEGISKLIKSSSNIILNEIEKREYSHTSKVEYHIPKKIIQKEPVSKEVSLSPEDKRLCFGKCEKAIYSFLNAYPDRTFSKSQIGAVTGYSPSSGSFSNAISKLSSVRYINRIGNDLQVNPQLLGSEIVADLISNFDFSIKNISNILGKCEKEIYNILLENPGEEFTKESLAEITPSKYSASSGSYSNALSRLSTLGLLIKSNGMIKLNPELNEV